jgi:hypothetical protein
VAGIGVMSVLLVLASGFSGLGSRLREIGHGREIDRHRQAIDELRADNARLRGVLAARAAPATPAVPAAPPPGAVRAAEQAGT